MRSAKKKKINDASSPKIQNSSLISLKDVSNNLWDKKILKNISWSTKFGQNWAIMGPNGAGKSVLIKIILGQLPYFGTIIRHEKISNFEKIVDSCSPNSNDSDLFFNVKLIFRLGVLSP